MAFIRTKGPIPSDSDNYYKYLVKTVSEDGKSKQKHLAYLGPADGPDDTSLGDIALSELNDKLDDEHELGYGEYEDLSNYGSTKGKGADEMEEGNEEKLGDMEVRDITVDGGAFPDEDYKEFTYWGSDLRIPERDWEEAKRILEEEYDGNEAEFVDNYFVIGKPKQGKAGLMEDAEEDLGGAISEQLEDIIEGEILLSQNPNALKAIGEYLNEQDEEEMARQVNWYVDEVEGGGSPASEVKETSVKKDRSDKKVKKKSKVTQLNEMEKGETLFAENPNPTEDYYIPYKYTGKSKKMDGVEKHFFRDERNPDKYGKWFSKNEIKKMKELTKKVEEQK